MATAGILLTGGASRRMGRDKADLVLGPSGLSLAERTARLIEAVAAPAIEVGPGHSHLRAVAENPPGQGPLFGLTTGWAAIRHPGWSGPVLVVATDLPLLSAGMVAFLAAHPSDRSVVPVAGGRVQPLCARYLPADLDRAAGLVREGRRSMTALLEVIDAYNPDEEEWAGPAGSRLALDDIDTPDDLGRGEIR